MPEGRSYVVDDAPRLRVTDYDYRGLLELDDDVIQLDWDTAVSRTDLTLFAALARQQPHRVLVAPVPVERDRTERVVWNLRRYTDAGEQAMREVTEQDETCHLFGFGMVYLPRSLIRSYVDALGGRPFTDTGFAGWVHRNDEPETCIAWQVRPIHLHYRIDQVPL